MSERDVFESINHDGLSPIASSIRNAATASERARIYATADCNLLRPLINLQSKFRESIGEVDFHPYLKEDPRRVFVLMEVIEEITRLKGVIMGPADNRDVASLMLGIGRWLWPYTYRLFPNDDRWAAELAHHMWSLLSPTLHDDAPGAAPWLSALAAASARWVDGAQRILTTTPKYFAALASTQISESAFEDIMVPWPVFMVHVPPGMMADGGKDYDRISLEILHNVPVSMPDRSVVLTTTCRLHVFTSKSPWDAMHATMSNADAVEAVLFREMPEHDLTTKESRILQTAKRVVVGLLYTLQHTNHWRERVVYGRVHRNTRDNPPAHRVIFVGRPIGVNAISPVRSFISHGSNGNHVAPAVQTLVRGHTKRQVAGPGRILRKIIWVEPYWRGPEDAPILSRPFQVGGAA